MNYINIKTPLELFKYMEDNIKYGFVDSDNNIYTPDQNDFDDICYKLWRLSDAKRLLEVKHGHCWDQVEFEREWFKNNNFNFKTIFIWFNLDYENTYSTHTYLVYEKDNKWYYFEHADYINRGIYEFDSLEDAIEFQKDKHIEYNSKTNIVDENIINKLEIYEYNNPVIGCNMLEFINNILDKAKKIK